jgi:flagellar export protein FliJ
MAFHFALETVLQLRTMLEEQAQLRLLESLTRVQMLEHQLQQAAQWREETLRQMAAELEAPAAELHFAEAVLRQAAHAVKQCREQAERERKCAAELRAAYLQARQEREKLSSLRATAERRYALQELRREQEQLDEIALREQLRRKTQPGLHGA